VSLSGPRQNGADGLVSWVMASGQPVMEALLGDLPEAKRPLELNRVPALAPVPLV
jgi:hypothetical protein